MSSPSDKSTALISVKVYTHGGKEVLRRLFAEISSKAEILHVSAVYKVHRVFENPRSLHDLRNIETFEGLCVVAKVNWSEPSGVVMEHLKQVEMEFSRAFSHKMVSLNLLVHGSRLVTTPSLTLPHPDFHLKPEEVVPGAEVWEGWQHPIHDESLGDLAQKFISSSWGEFYARGKTVLDF